MLLLKIQYLHRWGCWLFILIKPTYRDGPAIFSWGLCIRYVKTFISQEFAPNCTYKALRTEYIIRNIDITHFHRLAVRQTSVAPQSEKMERFCIEPSLEFYWHLIDWFVRKNTSRRKLLKLPSPQVVAITIDISASKKGWVLVCMRSLSIIIGINSLYLLSAYTFHVSMVELRKTSANNGLFCGLDSQWTVVENFLLVYNLQLFFFFFGLAFFLHYNGGQFLQPIKISFISHTLQVNLMRDIYFSSSHIIQDNGEVCPIAIYEISLRVQLVLSPNCKSIFLPAVSIFKRAHRILCTHFCKHWVGKFQERLQGSCEVHATHIQFHNGGHETNQKHKQQLFLFFACHYIT